MELQPQRLDPTSIIECHVQVSTEQLICVPTKQPTLFFPGFDKSRRVSCTFQLQSSSFPPPKKHLSKPTTKRSPVIFGIRQVSYQNVVREMGAPPVPLSLLLPVQDAEVQDRSAVGFPANSATKKVPAKVLRGSIWKNTHRIHVVTGIFTYI